MRIVARQKDFYDCMLAYGQEDDITYIRTPRKVNYEFKSKDGSGYINRQWPFHAVVNWRGRYSSNWVGRLWADDLAVGFCGKVYPCWRIYITHPSSSFRYGRDEDYPIEYCYTLEHVDTYVNTYCTEKEKEDYLTPPNDDSSKRRRYRNNFRHAHRQVIVRRSSFEYCLNKYDEYQESYVKIFEREDCPIFVAENDWHQPFVTYNGNLGQVHFQRVKPPMEAYRDLFMYLSNKARPEKPIPEISDKVMAEAKGFNKYSFRKDKTK